MYTIRPRLQIYTNLLGSYDSIDKYKYSEIKFCFISTLKLQYSTLKLTNKNLSSILFQEFATNQRFNFFYNKKINFLRKFYLTLRNVCLYYYFEFLINSDLLVNKLKKKIHISYTTINTSMYIIVTNFYVNFLNDKITFKHNLEKIKINFNWKNKILFLNNFFSYYYIS